MERMPLFRFFVALSISFATLAEATNAFAFDRAACPASGDRSPGYPIEIETDDGPYATSIKLSGYKTKAELEQYFGRYLKCYGLDSRQHLYVEQYREMIEDAAKASGIPFAILACLYFFESKFDREIVSPVGAKGLGQIMPGTWDDIKIDLNPVNARVSNPYLPSTILEKVQEDDPAEVKDAARRIRALYDRAWNKKKRELRGKENLIELEKQLERLAKYPTYARRAHVAEYLTNAETALNRIYTQEIYRDYFEARGGKKGPSSADLFNAEYSAILGAIRLRRVYKDLFDLKVSVGSRDQWVMAVGAYNSGPGNIRCKATHSADECIRMTNIGESKDHMIAVKNCSEHGNKEYKPPRAGKPGDGVREGC